MYANISMEKFIDARHRFFQWRNELDYARMTMLALAFAFLTGMSSFVRVYTPISAVPFTLQTFIVLMSGMVLGHKWGGISQTLYVGLALAGIPWTTQGGGFDAVFGYTGGYLLGFIIAAFVVGYLTDLDAKYRTAKFQVPIMTLGMLLIYIPGVAVLSAITSMPLMGMNGAIMLGAGVFIIWDIVKLAMAGAAGKFLLTKKAF
ncbi:MAG: biotin transporter BioY [Candidatus Thermoplasmatota archaeon]|nr:biotin transporter BioY [Euryarchaeota archaeon]MBU4031988.1 biotin transporter BioY [Candidatus Thermoplasmatota archaeon]MBU4070963.1 biotin transporter BioY [Candidatus Thermoplasmatota archaeon]MBU4144344.1 biotin transporter BioY [Candidatus Thermoplasmatota archaeon]MBU4591940.1 biotin transporter BioY [Candidatus Thermoplasmatota archaeon]